MAIQGTPGERTGTPTSCANLSGMIGVVAAAGTGSRLWPLTVAINKHLLPIYDKPMIYYPLSTVMAAGCRDILIVTNPQFVGAFEDLLGDGSEFGVAIRYRAQPRPAGIADTLKVVASEVAGQPVVLALGDNVMYGHGLGRGLLSEPDRSGGSQIFAYEVRNPWDYGVVTWSEDGQSAVNLVEKPPRTTSSGWAVPGLYLYGPEVWHELAELAPSARGELEITDVNRSLLDKQLLSVTRLPRGSVWFDAGSVQQLARASEFVRVVQERQRTLIGSPHEVAVNQGWISPQELRNWISSRSSLYAENLAEVADVDGWARN